MTATLINDHVTQALARLAEQYKSKPRIQGLLTALVEQVQDIDDAAWELATKMYLFNDSDLGFATVFEEAEGVQLDILGVILGQEREALNDADYRLALKASVRLHKSSGTVENLLSIFHVLLPLSLLTVEIDPPACFTLTIDEVITATEALLYLRFLRRGRAAGVRGIMYWQESDDADSLTFSDAAAYPEVDTHTGLGDVTDPLAGGDLTGADE